MKTKTKDLTLAVVEGKSLTAPDMMSAIDDMIVDLHQTGDIEKATRVLAALNGLEVVTGLAKAKLLYGMSQWWEGTGQSDIRGMEFSDYIEGSHILKKTPLDRALVVWEHVNNLDIPKEFHNRPIKELVPIAKALEQGFDISKEQWDKLRIADGEGDVREIIQKDVKKKEHRKSALVGTWERTGDLYVRQGNKQREHVGYLDREAYDKSDVVKKFIKMDNIDYSS